MLKIRDAITIFLACLLLYSCGNLSGSSDSWEDLFRKAQAFEQQSEMLYQKAIRHYERSLDTKHEKDKTHYYLGRLQYMRGQYTLAIENLLRSDLTDAKKILGICYYQIGQYTDALSIFAKTKDIKDDEYFFYYASTCEKRNLYPQAIELYQKIQGPPYQAKAQKRIEEIQALDQDLTLESLDQEIRNLIANAPGPQDFPQAGAIVLYSKQEIEVREDNTMEYVEHYLVKILNDRGRGLGEVHIGYDSTYEKVDVNFARTIKPDGKVISVGAKHIRDVSKYLNFPLYSNARVKIISMPEVSPGVFLEYKIRGSVHKMVAENKFRKIYVVQSEHPIQHAELRIALPETQILHQKNLNEEFNHQGFDLAPSVQSINGKTIYSWIFRNVNQIISEPSMPPLAEATPVIVLTTFASWQEIYQWWWGLAKDKIETNQAMRDKILELTNDRMSLVEKAKALYNFCAREIRYVAIEYGQAGYEPHKATEIFTNKYGDCKDQSILLIAMLREAGVEAFPVLIGTKGVPRISKDFPALLFNHCIVLARINGEDFFMDPTGETVLFGDLPFSDQNRKVLVFFDNEARLMKTPHWPAHHNALVRKTILRFQEDESILAERNVETFGMFDHSQRRWLRYTMPLLIKESLQQSIQSVLPGSVILDYETQNAEEMESPIVLSYRFEGTDFLIKAGQKRRIIPQLGTLDLRLVSKTNRDYPIDFTLLQSYLDIFEIHLGTQYKIESLPQPIKEDNPWFTYENIYEQKGQAIIFTQKNIIKKDRVEVNDYLSYKEILENLSKEIRQSIILEKKL